MYHFSALIEPAQLGVICWLWSAYMHVATSAQLSCLVKLPVVLPLCRSQETGQVTVPSSAPARGTTSAPAPPQLQDASPASASTATRNLLVILHGKRVDDELLRNALQEVKQQGHKVRGAFVT